MTDGWARCLDDLSVRLLQQRTALQDGRYEDVLPFAPPADLGPLPADLADAARELLAECEQLCQGLASAAADRARQLRAVTAFGPGNSGSSCFVDSRT